MISVTKKKKITGEEEKKDKKKALEESSIKDYEFEDWLQDFINKIIKSYDLKLQEKQ